MEQLVLLFVVLLSICGAQTGSADDDVVMPLSRNKNERCLPLQVESLAKTSIHMIARIYTKQFRFAIKGMDLTCYYYYYCTACNTIYDLRHARAVQYTTRILLRTLAIPLV